MHARQITLYGMLKSGVGSETIAPLDRNRIGYPEKKNIININSTSYIKLGNQIV